MKARGFAAGFFVRNGIKKLRAILLALILMREVCCRLIPHERQMQFGVRSIFLMVANAAALCTCEAKGDLFVAGRDPFVVPKVARYNELTGAFLGYMPAAGEVTAGLTVANDHELYVAGDAFGQGELRRSSGPAQGIIIASSTFPNHGWTVPQSLVTGTDGHLYVTSNFNGSYGSLSTEGVLEYKTDGTFLGKFADTGGSYLAFGPNGDLFVSTGGPYQFSNTGRGGMTVVRYAGSTGASLGTFVSAGSGGLSFPSGITFGSDSKLYVSDISNDRVLRFDGTTGSFVDVFVPSGSGGLDAPYDLKFGPSGDLFVCSGATDSVLRYNGITGAFIAAFIPNSLPLNGGWIHTPQYLSFGTIPEASGFASSLVLLSLFTTRQRMRVREA